MQSPAGALSQCACVVGMVKGMLYPTCCHLSTHPACNMEVDVLMRHCLLKLGSLTLGSHCKQCLNSGNSFALMNVQYK